MWLRCQVRGSGELPVWNDEHKNMKRICYSFILVAFLLKAFPGLAMGQEQGLQERFLSYSKLLSPEKLYISTDRESYRVGDTIWLKGYLKNNSLLAEFPESNYIYVELFSSMVEKNHNTETDENVEAVRCRVKIKRADGTFSGYIPVPENLNTGIAVLRGYTYWMMNRSPEYMFNKNIEIRNPMKDEVVDAMRERQVRETYKYSEIGEKNPFAETEKTKRDIDIQFMPESGRYVTGQNSVVAYKAIDETGLGTKVNGTLYKDGVPYCDFESDDSGMGLLNLYFDEMPDEIYAQVSESDGFSVRADFPKPQERAVVINLRPDSSGVSILVSSRNMQGCDSLHIVMYDGSEIYLNIPYNLQKARYRMDYAYFSSGINNVAVVDGKGNLYAHRSFFVFPPQNDISFTTDRQEYGPMEKVVCTFDMRDSSGAPLSGDFSVAVSDDIYAPYSGKNHNIVSYFLLGSEIDGVVEHPQKYFDSSIPLKERIEAADLLMLAQRWRYYSLPEILKGESEFPYFGKEYTQSISGQVYGLFKTAKKSIVTFIAPSTGFSAMGQLDTSGWFALNGLDFPDSTQFIVGAVGLDGMKRRFTPILDPDIFAIPFSYPKYIVPQKYPDSYKVAAMSDYYNSGGELVYSIDPVYITGRRSPEKNNITPLPYYSFKEGDYVGEEALKPYQTYDLLTYIVTTCPPLRFADSTRNGARYIECRTKRISSRMGITSGWDEIIVFINGMLSSCADLEGMTVADITGFAHLTGVEAAKFGVYASDAISPRDVVMVQTRMYDRDRPAMNVAEGMPLGWQKPVKRYVPKYETEASRRGREPMRALVHWEPCLKVSDGKATVEFYSSSHKADYTLILEGMTGNSEPLFLKGHISRGVQR